MSRKLEGKTALVTGASRGIGAAIAKRLAADGARVAITYSKGADAAASVVRSIEAAGGKAIAIQADATDSAAVKAAVEKTVSALGKLDVLVNNAGTAIPKKFEETTLEEKRGMFGSLNSGSLPKLRTGAIGQVLADRVRLPQHQVAVAQGRHLAHRIDCEIVGMAVAMYVLTMTRTLALAAFCTAMLPLSTASAQQATEIQISYSNGQFQPREVRAPADKPVVFRIRNLDGKAMEFESTSLRVEKVVAAKSQGVINVRALKAGRYEFYDDFNEKARGALVVE